MKVLARVLVMLLWLLYRNHNIDSGDYIRLTSALVDEGLVDVGTYPKID